MSAPDPAPARASRRRAPLFLLLFLFTLGAAARTVRGADSAAEACGALLFPVLFLLLGTRYAFREEGRIARGAAVGLLVTFAVSFSVGIVRGVQRHEGMERLGRQAEAISNDIASSARSGEELSTSAIGERVRSMTDDLSAADPTSAAVARTVQAVFDLTAPKGERFEAAVTCLQQERFLDVSAMLRDDDFAWQHAAIDEYEAAARDSLATIRDTPRLTREAGTREGVPRDVLEQVLAGTRSSAALQEKLFEAHLGAAQAYRSAVALVEEDREAFEVYEDGSFDVVDDEAAAAYDRQMGRVGAAEEALAQAIEAYLRFLDR